METNNSFRYLWRQLKPFNMTTPTKGRVTQLTNANQR